METMRNNLPFYQQFQPRVFSEMVGLEYLQNQFWFITNSHTHNILIITGSYGSGKSTLASMIIKRTYCLNPNGTDACLDCLNCQNVDDLFGLSDCLATSGDKVTVELLKDIELRHFAHYPRTLPERLVFIDDLDLAEAGILARLVGLLNRCPGKTFVFTASGIARIPDPVRQRSKIIRLLPCSRESLEDYVKQICAKAGINISEDEAVGSLVSLASLNPRKIINALEIIKGEGLGLRRNIFSIPIVRDNIMQYQS